MLNQVEATPAAINLIKEIQNDLLIFYFINLEVVVMVVLR